MISAGTGSVKQQFYEKGSLEAIDWGEVAGKSTVGGITGTATAYGGAKLSESLTTKLSQNAFVDSLLHSDSAAKRVAMNMAVSSTSEVGTGMGTRFLGGFLTTGGNVKEAWAQASNPQSILFDATLGGSMGGVKGIPKPTDYTVINTVPAEETNQWFIDDTPGYNPPYKPGTKVNEIVLQEGNDIKFVRVYDKDVSGMKGSWIMRAEDIEGLTPSQIKDKYALPAIPKYICDVEIKPGTHLREGIANEVDGWGKGGGRQIDLMKQKIGEFKNERMLGD